MFIQKNNFENLLSILQISRHFILSFLKGSFLKRTYFAPPELCFAEWQILEVKPNLKLLDAADVRLQSQLFTQRSNKLAQLHYY